MKHKFKFLYSDYVILVFRCTKCSTKTTITRSLWKGLVGKKQYIYENSSIWWVLKHFESYNENIPCR